MTKNNFNVDFIGIGAYKCGTTWLAGIAAQHPEICFSSIKEVNYFNRKSRKDVLNRSFDMPLEYYRSFWPKNIPANNKVGEFSPAYFCDKEAPKKIKKYFPKVKLIVVLRDPVERAFSHYLFDKNTRSDSFKKAVKTYEFLLKNSKYYENLKKYYDLFPKSQIKAFLFDDIKSNPEKVTKEFYKFINVNPNFKPNLDAKNITGSEKYAWLRGLLDFFVRFPGKAAAFLKKIFPESFILKIAKSKPIKIYYNLIAKIRIINFKKTPKPKISPEDRKELCRYFRKDIEKLEKLIKRDLSAWKK